MRFPCSEGMWGVCFRERNRFPKKGLPLQKERCDWGTEKGKRKSAPTPAYREVKRRPLGRGPGAGDLAISKGKGDFEKKKFLHLQ